MKRPNFLSHLRRTDKASKQKRLWSSKHLKDSAMPHISCQKEKTTLYLAKGPPPYSGPTCTWVYRPKATMTLGLKLENKILSVIDEALLRQEAKNECADRQVLLLLLFMHRPRSRWVQNGISTSVVFI